MNSGTKVSPTLELSVRTAGGVTIGELTGEIDIASVPALRERFLGLLRPGSSRLVIDLSEVSFCDASGLAVLVGTGRRARLLGGFLHLAAVSPQVGRVLQVAGLLRSFAIFPTVQAAAAGPRPAEARRAGMAAASVPAARALPGPAGRHSGPPLVAVDAGELRGAVAALLAGADAWHDADPGRRFTPALRAMAARATAPTTLPWIRRPDPCCPPSPATPSPTPRQSPQPQPA